MGGKRMTRSEFWEWMNTCPNKDWFQAADDGGGIRIYFPVDEDPEENETSVACEIWVPLIDPEPDGWTPEKESEPQRERNIGEIMSLKYKMEARKN
tara:strand:+ start:829 stop:1116 length:288 start_codon:yes stop_codon:yes gene_type:complete